MRNLIGIAALLLTWSSTQAQEPWLHMITEVQGVRIEDDFIRLTPPGWGIDQTDRLRVLSTRASYTGDIEITVVARAKGGSIRLFAAKVAMVILNWEGDMKTLVVHRPDSDGSRLASGSAELVPFEPLARDSWYKLRWKITENGMGVSVDDQVVFQETRKYDLSASERVGIGGGDSPVEIKSFEVKPTDEKRNDGPPGNWGDFSPDGRHMAACFPGLRTSAEVTTLLNLFTGGKKPLPRAITA